MKEIELRRSIRKYQNTEIEKETIEKLIESARLTPSGNNRQPWHFILVADKSIKEKIVEKANNQKWMLTAPLFIVCVADVKARINSEDEMYVDEETPMFELKRVIRDTAIATENIILEAVNRGLGTCWVGWFKQNEIRQVLEIPSDKFVIGILTVGVPDENPEQRPRNSISEIMHYNKW
jgi:nitroreductase